MAKPDPEAFRRACARWGLPPAAVLSVGDRHDLDVLPARAAGLAAVLLDRDGAGTAGEPSRIRPLADLRGGSVAGFAESARAMPAAHEPYADRGHIGRSDGTRR